MYVGDREVMVSRLTLLSQVSFELSCPVSYSALLSRCEGLISIFSQKLNFSSFFFSLRCTEEHGVCPSSVRQ